VAVWCGSAAAGMRLNKLSLMATSCSTFEGLRPHRKENVFCGWGTPRCPLAGDGACCGESRGSLTRTIIENESSRTKTKTQDKGQLKSSSFNSWFLKSRSPLHAPVRLLL
jgi:hypothetical protein